MAEKEYEKLRELVEKIKERLRKIGGRGG